jgi:MFS family permease
MSEASARQKMSLKDLMIVLVISLGSFMAGLDVTIVNIALPSIGKAFDVAFLVLMCAEVLGILLMLPVKEEETGYSTDGEPVIAF